MLLFSFKLKALYCANLCGRCKIYIRSETNVYKIGREFFEKIINLSGFYGMFYRCFHTIQYLALKLPVKISIFFQHILRNFQQFLHSLSFSVLLSNLSSVSLLKRTLFFREFTLGSFIIPVLKLPSFGFPDTMICLIIKCS